MVKHNEIATILLNSWRNKVIKMGECDTFSKMHMLRFIGFNFIGILKEKCDDSHNFYSSFRMLAKVIAKI